MPPYSSSKEPAMSPASVNTFSARPTSGMSSTLPSTIRGSCSSAVRLCGAKWSVAICSARSRTASNVSRECSVNRARLVSDSTSSHSCSRKSRSRRDRINDEALTRASVLPGVAQGASTDVDRAQSWGFMVRWTASSGIIRTGDRVAGGVVQELLQSLLDAAPLEGLVSDEQVLNRTKLLVAVHNAVDAELT